MKIPFLTVLLPVLFFCAQSALAQDSTHNNLPAPKKTSKHRHVAKDSAVRMISDSAGNNLPGSHDSSALSPSVSQTDSKTGSTSQDSSVATIPHRGKSNKHQGVINDSTDFVAKLFYNNVVRVIRLPRRKIKLSVLPIDSVIDNDFIVDSARAAISDSIKFVIKDSLFTADSLKAIATAYTDSVYSDSVSRHWIGWKKYQVKPDQSFAMFSKKVLKGKSKAELQYNIADFYLYLNGQLVMPPIKGYGFFAAGCLCFKYDDTLLLNSGLGFKVGVGVGIKIIQGRFTSALHANTHNKEVYKLSKDDTVYLRSVMSEPATQSLKLQNEPGYVDKEIIIGEYRATYKKFYQKNKDDEDEGRQYMVRIIFRCRVSGGIDSMKSLNVTVGK